MKLIWSLEGQHYRDWLCAVWGPSFLLTQLPQGGFSAPLLGTVWVFAVVGLNLGHFPALHLCLVLCT